MPVRSATLTHLIMAMQVLYFLSGLTCTDENVTTKSGIQRKAAEEGIAIIAPDTSPRGLNMYAPASYTPKDWHVSILSPASV